MILGFYLLMITLAEVLTTALHQPIIGLFVHGLVMIGLVSHASLWTDGKLRRGLIFLALIPLTRLMSLAMPLSSFPRIYWYPIIGAPLLLAAALAAHQSEIGFADIGLVLRKPILQILVGLCGVGLGYAEYKILRPEALITQPSLSQVLIPAIILTLFTGVLEEVLFRGMLQPAVCALLGKWSGLIFTALLFAVMHLGYLSVLDVAFVFAVGLVFGWIAQSTGSIFGVILAHSLTNIGLFLFFPFWN